MRRADSTLPEIKDSYYGIADNIPSLIEALKSATDADLKGLGERATLVKASTDLQKAFSKLDNIGVKL